jgi:murein DD-endopeptidase MepM/ murein hydrolase activator NlpD
MEQTTLIPKPYSQREFIDNTKNSQKVLVNAQSSIVNITNILRERTKKRENISSNIIDSKKRREFLSRRQESEEELESKNIIRAPNIGGIVRLASRSGKGLIDRIVSSLGYLAAGWILRNLPTWTGMAKEFIARLQEAGRIIKSFVTGAINVFQSSFRLISGAIENLKNFDLFDSSNKVRGSFNELVQSINTMGSEIEAGVKLITTPLTQTTEDGRQVGSYSGQDVPALGSTSSDMGAYGPAAPSGLFELIARSEGGYESVNRGDAGDSPGGAKKYLGKNLQDMTLSEIMSLQSQGKVFAVGKYQIITQTMPGFVRWIESKGYDPKTTKYTAKIQDLYPQYTVESKRPQVGKFLSGSMNDIQKANLELAAEFASVGVPFDMKAGSYGGGWPKRDIKKGESLYSGRSGNRASISPEKVQQALREAKASGGNLSPTKAVSSPQQSALPTNIVQVPPGNIKPVVGDRLGAGRNHGGVDLAVPDGTPLRAISDGVIVDSDNDPGGWGNFLVMKDDRGIYHLYGHMRSGYKRSGPVKKGEVIGKVGMTGRTSGPHLHWEAGSGWNGGVITGRFDPLNTYSQFAPFNTPYSDKSESQTEAQQSPTKQVQVPLQPTATAPSTPPAQISQTPTQQRQQQLAQQITPERKAQDIIAIIGDQQGEPTPQVMMQPVSSGMKSGPSMTTVLNNFMKQKLLLELAYV